MDVFRTKRHSSLPELVERLAVWNVAGECATNYSGQCTMVKEDGDCMTEEG